MPAIGLPYKTGTIVMNGTALSGIQSPQFPLNVQTTDVNADGALAPVASPITKIEPQATFDATDLAMLAGTSSLLDGIPITSSNVIEFYLERLQKNAGIQSGANHDKCTITEGLFYATQLQCQVNGIASLSCIIGATRDHDATGVQTNPITWTSSVALPTLQDVNTYGLGFLFINGNRIDLTLQSVQVNISPNIVPYHAGNSTYGKYYIIQGYTTKTQLTFNDASLVGLLGQYGDITSDTSKLFFQRRQKNSVFEPMGDNKHVSMSLSGSFQFDQLFGGDTTSLNQTTMTINHTSTSAGSAPITFAAGIAMPLTLS